ncbi:MAG: hypothetical protein K0Q78_2125, partial [Cellvibrio sp.]|nr:hypothetical protein [Cellvibrio sp.]
MNDSLSSTVDIIETGQPQAKAQPFELKQIAPAVHKLRILTLNMHKGFSVFNRQFV